MAQARNLFLSMVCLFFLANVARSEQPANTRLLLQKYCVHCHNADDHEGDVKLNHLLQDDSALFGRIYEQLSSGQMPPDDEQQPTSEERKQLASHFLSLARTSSVPESAI